MPRDRVVLSPLPCWEHLPEKSWRRCVVDLVASIDEQGSCERKDKRKKSLGVKKILQGKPTRRPKTVKKSDRPRYHAVSALAFKRWFEGFSEMLRAYGDASTLLREERDRSAEFPEGTFPPALPFEPFADNLMMGARGQPA